MVFWKVLPTAVSFVHKSIMQKIYTNCRYDRHMNKVKGIGSPTKSSPQRPPQPPQLPQPQRAPQQEVSLIDLADEPPSAQLATLSM